MKRAAESSPLRLDPQPVLRHAGWMRSLALSLVRDEAQAEDVVQETWLALLEKPPRGERPPEPRATIAWLRSVVRNFAFMSLRKESRRRRRELRAARREEVATTPQGLLERAELSRFLSEMVLALEEPYRSTILLRFFEELSLEEIARIERAPLSTVKTRLRRGLERLRAGLDRAHGGDRRAWTLPLLPHLGRAVLLKPASPASFVPLTMIGGSMAALGSKSIAAAAVLLTCILGVSGFLLRNSLYRESGPPAERASARGPSEPAAARDPEPLAAAPRPEAQAPAEPAGEPAPVAERGPPPEALESGPEKKGPLSAARPAPPPPPLSELSAEYSRLRAIFAGGGKSGRAALKENISSIRELLATDAGLGELLALLDGEESTDFLEGLLHFLPLAVGEHQEPVLQDQELQDQLWSRFEADADPERRRAYLGFFSYNPRLREGKLESFLEVARSDPERVVRAQALDALTSAGNLPDAWPTLSAVAESDPEVTLRASAIEGLARATSEEAQAVRRAAFRSGLESIRAAAVRSIAAESPAPEILGPDEAAYLRREIREAETAEYKAALFDRLRKVSPAGWEEEATRALPVEKDRRVRSALRRALEEAKQKQAPGSP